MLLVCPTNSVMEHTSSSWSPECPPLGSVKPRVSSAVSQLPHRVDRRCHLCKGELGVMACDLVLKKERIKLKPRSRADSLRWDLCCQEGFMLCRLAECEGI